MTDACIAAGYGSSRTPRIMPTKHSPVYKKPVTEGAAPETDHRSQAAEVVSRIYGKAAGLSMPVPEKPDAIPQPESAPQTEPKESVPVDPRPDDSTSKPDVPIPLMTPTERNPRPIRKMKRKFSPVSLLAGFLLGVFVMTGFGYVRSQKMKLSSMPVSSGTTPTPSPVPGPLKQDISVEVLNGAGVAGAAGRAAKEVEKLGFSVALIGNADTATYAASLLSVREGYADVFSRFLPDFEKEFGITRISGTFSDSTASARLTVGRDWAKK